MHYNADGSLVDLFLDDVMKDAMRRPWTGGHRQDIKETFNAQKDNPIWKTIEQLVKEDKWKPKLEDLYRKIKIYFDNLASFADGFKETIKQVEKIKNDNSKPAAKVPEINTIDGSMDEDDKNMMNVVQGERQKGEASQKKEQGDSKKTAKKTGNNQILESEKFYIRDTHTFNKSLVEFVIIRPRITSLLAVITSTQDTIQRLTAELPVVGRRVLELEKLYNEIKRNYDIIGGYNYILSQMQSALVVKQSIDNFELRYTPVRASVFASLTAVRIARAVNPIIPNGYPEAKAVYDRIQQQISAIRTEMENALAADNANSSLNAAIARKQRLQGELLNLRRSRETSTAIISSSAALAALDVEIQQKVNAIQQADAEIAQGRQSQEQYEARITTIETNNADAIARYNNLKRQYDQNLANEQSENARNQENQNFIDTVDEALTRAKSNLLATLDTFRSLNAKPAAVKKQFDDTSKEYMRIFGVLFVNRKIFSEIEIFIPDIEEMMTWFADYDKRSPQLPKLLNEFFKTKAECRAAIDSL